MKNITKTEIKELLTIIPRNYPSLDIYHLTDGLDELSIQLYNLCHSQGYQYDLLVPNQENFEQLNQNSELKPKKFYYEKNRYNLHSRVYDFVFVSICLEKVDNIDTFYKKIYAISKNGGKVLYILNKNHNLREFEETLIKHNYVAVNPIEDTFENYQIISANKMHGWDN